MTSLLIVFLAHDEGQDLIEYTLLMAFIVVSVAGLMMGLGDSVKTITSISKSQIDLANTMLH
jgi:Flp pilus assembly pilin Flp